MQTLNYTIEYVPWWIGLVFGLLAAIVVLSAGMYLLVEYNKRTGKKPNTYSVTLTGLLILIFSPLLMAFEPPAFLSVVTVAEGESTLTVATLRAGQVQSLGASGVSGNVTLSDEIYLVCDTEGKCATFSSGTKVDVIVDHFVEKNQSDKTVVNVKY